MRVREGGGGKEGSSFPPPRVAGAACETILYYSVNGSDRRLRERVGEKEGEVDSGEIIYRLQIT